MRIFRSRCQQLPRLNTPSDEVDESVLMGATIAQTWGMHHSGALGTWDGLSGGWISGEREGPPGLVSHATHTYLPLHSQ